MAYLAGPGADKATAPPVMDGFTPEQRFFIGFAQIWCENRRPEFERLRAATDPHSSGKYRVNGVVSNMPEFQKAFSCKADAPMVQTESVSRVVTRANLVIGHLVIWSIDQPSDRPDVQLTRLTR